MLVAMSVTQHGGPGAPYGPPPHVPGGAPAPPPGQPPYGWQQVPQPPRHRGSKVLAAGVIAAIVLATAALVVGIVDLTRSTPAPAVASSGPSTPTAPAGDTSTADRALCTAIAPLMGENDRINNTYGQLGDAGSPPRDAATPKFVTDTEDWAGRIQPILDQHPDANPYLRRTTQRFIDDQRLLASDITTGPLQEYIKSLFSDSIAAYAGPLHVCYELGVKW
jgi:hypothetical protein